jgi:hypothetical protein
MGAAQGRTEDRVLATIHVGRIRARRIVAIRLRPSGATPHHRTVVTRPRRITAIRRRRAAAIPRLHIVARPDTQEAAARTVGGAGTPIVAVVVILTAGAEATSPAEVTPLVEVTLAAASRSRHAK